MLSPKEKRERASRSDCKPNRSRVCPPGKREKDGLLSVEAIVDDYIHCCRLGASEELSFFKGQTNLKDVIRLAALARTPEDKRHNHQRRISQRDLARWYKTLTTRIKKIQSCGSFQELFEFVEKIGEMTKGIGDLAIYDTAQRIGAYVGLSPNVVYLHAGTREGASALGLGQGRKWIAPHELPRAFGRLSACEIEDCLCIYKDDINRFSVTTR